jgi:hypothetical protein
LRRRHAGGFKVDNCDTVHGKSNKLGVGNGELEMGRVDNREALATVRLSRSMHVWNIGGQASR